MTFKLVHRGKEEAIDTISISSDMAKKYFMDLKRLDEKSFDMVFEVKEVPSHHTPPLNYKWWKEESKNLDIEKE
jgi:hypothetical protein